MLFRRHEHLRAPADVQIRTFVYKRQMENMRGCTEAKAPFIKSAHGIATSRPESEAGAGGGAGGGAPTQLGEAGDTERGRCAAGGGDTAVGSGGEVQQGKQKGELVQQEKQKQEEGQGQEQQRNRNRNRRMRGRRRTSRRHGREQEGEQQEKQKQKGQQEGEEEEEEQRRSRSGPDGHENCVGQRPLPILARTCRSAHARRATLIAHGSPLFTQLSIP